MKLYISPKLNRICRCLLKRVFLIVMLSSFLSITALSQSDVEPLSSIRYGIWGGWHNVLHSAEFSGFTGTETAPKNFGSFQSTGFDAGLMFNSSLSNNLGFVIRGGYSSFGILANQQEEITLFAPNSTTPLTTNINYTLSGSLQALSVDLMLRGKVSGFFLDAGASFAMVLPLQIAFSNSLTNSTLLGGSTSLVGGGTSDIKTTTLTLVPSFIANIGYEFALNDTKTIFLSPEISVRTSYQGAGNFGVPLLASNLVNGNPGFWNVTRLTAGFTVSFGSEPPPPIIEEKPLPIYPPPIKEPIDKANEVIARNSPVFVMPPPTFLPLPPMMPPPPRFEINISAMVAETANQKANEPIRIEEFLIDTTVIPLLPYIFFAPKSSEIPSRYKQLTTKQAAVFSEQDLRNKSAVEIYRNILSIVGKRMQGQPKATLTVTGIYGSDEQMTQGRLRANRVKNMLVDIWNIEDNRVKTSTQELSGEKNPLAYSVSFSSSDNKVTDPIMVIQDTTRTISTRSVVFIPEVVSPMGIRDWSLQTFVFGTPFFSERGKDSIPQSLTLYIDDNRLRQISSSARSIDFSLKAKDKSGEEQKSRTLPIPLDFITIRQKNERRQYEAVTTKSYLVLFDESLPLLQPIMTNIKAALQKNVVSESSITLTEYTASRSDNKADEDKALFHAYKIKSLFTKGKIDVVAGRGLTVDPLKPEELIYADCVEVVMKTPQK